MRWFEAPGPLAVPIRRRPGLDALFVYKLRKARARFVRLDRIARSRARHRLVEFVTKARESAKSRRFSADRISTESAKLDDFPADRPGWT
jgi:hypothetical protein